MREKVYFKACFGAWILYNKTKTALEHHREGYTCFNATNQATT